MHFRPCRRSTLDLYREYAAHQCALIGAGAAANDDERRVKLAKASSIAKQISVFQHGLGAAAACAWSKAQMAELAQQRAEMAGRA